MCIDSVVISVVSSVRFSLTFSYANATSYCPNLLLFLVVNEIKCKYENNSRLKSRRSFRRNNTLLSRIYFFNVNTKVNSFSLPESIFNKVTDRSLSCNFTERKHSDTGAFLMNFGDSVCSTENCFTNKIVRSPLKKEKKRKLPPRKQWHAFICFSWNTEITCSSVNLTMLL